MRADRLLSILLLLQVYRRLTARDLAKRLEVSERTIHRDMEALSVAGIPVVAERGSGGGWMLLEEYRTNLTGLNEAEIQALFVAQPARVLADLGLTKAAEAAVIKLFAALPAMQRHNAEYARQRLYIDATGWQRFDEAVPVLPTLQEAIFQDRRLRFSYERAQCETVERVVNPLGLVARGNVWYLVAGIEDSFRSYRVSRMREAVLLDEPCVRPKDFDLAAYWEQSKLQFKAQLPRYPVVVRAAPGVFERVRYSARYARIEQIEPLDQTDANGWITARILFQVEWEACEFLLGLGPQVEVLEPQTLREMIVQQAQRVMAIYAAAGCAAR